VTLYRLVLLEMYRQFQHVNILYMGEIHLYMLGSCMYRHWQPTEQYVQFMIDQLAFRCAHSASVLSRTCL